MRRYIREVVYERLNEGETIEVIWRSFGCRWTYLNRLRREWERKSGARLAVAENEIQPVERESRATE